MRLHAGGVTWDAVPKQSWLLKLRRNPALKPLLIEGDVFSIFILGSLGSKHWGHQRGAALGAGLATRERGKQKKYS